MIYSAQHCSPHGVSYDDVDLFARLRSITIIKGIQMPPKVYIIYGISYTVAKGDQA